MIHWKSGTAAALLGAALACGMAAFTAMPASAEETVKLELWSRQDPSGPLRAGNVVKAAERLNKEKATRDLALADALHPGWLSRMRESFAEALQNPVLLLS